MSRDGDIYAGSLRKGRRLNRIEIPRYTVAFPVRVATVDWKKRDINFECSQRFSETFVVERVAGMVHSDTASPEHIAQEADHPVSGLPPKGIWITRFERVPGRHAIYLDPI